MNYLQFVGNRRPLSIGKSFLSKGVMWYPVIYQESIPNGQWENLCAFPSFESAQQFIKLHTLPKDIL